MICIIFNLLVFLESFGWWIQSYENALTYTQPKEFFETTVFIIFQRITWFT